MSELEQEFKDWWKINVGDSAIPSEFYTAYKAFCSGWWLGRAEYLRCEINEEFSKEDK